MAGPDVAWFVLYHRRTEKGWLLMVLILLTATFAGPIHDILVTATLAS